MTDNPTKDYILKLIAEGYFWRCEEDRYIICENPEGDKPWEDPYICYDIYEGQEDD